MTLPSYIGSASNKSNAASSLAVNCATINAGAPAAINDMLLAVFASDGSDASVNEFIYPPRGWHEFLTAHNSGRSKMFYKFAESGDATSWTFRNGTTDEIICVVMCIRGVDPVNPISRASSTQPVSSATMGCLAETTALADCLAVCAYTVDGTGLGAVTPTATWTERFEDETTANGIYVQTKDFATAATSTGTASVTQGASTRFVGRMVVLQPPQVQSTRDVVVRSGKFTNRTSVGDQDITGLGFDCKALIVWGVRVANTTATVDAEFAYGIGADDGVNGNAQRYVGNWHDSGTNNDTRYGGGGEIIKLYAAGNSTLASPNYAGVYSKITDGFRIAWTGTSIASAVEWHYIAIGGASVQAVVGTVLATALSVASLPWRPDVVNVINSNINVTTDHISDESMISIGWLDATGGAFVSGNNYGENAFGGDNNNATFGDSGFVGRWEDGVQAWDVHWKQMTTTGFTWESVDEVIPADYFAYLALNFSQSPGVGSYPVSVSVDYDENSGVNGTDLKLPVFANGRRLQTLAMVQHYKASTAVGQEQGSVGWGWANYAAGGTAITQAAVMVVKGPDAARLSARRTSATALGLATDDVTAATYDRVKALVDPPLLIDNVTSQVRETLFGMIEFGQQEGSVSLAMPIFPTATN